MSDAATTQDSRPLTQDGPPIRLYLIDGSAYIFRAYHALPPLTRKSDGLPVGAVAGFCNMLFKLLRDTKEDAPTHFAVIFDHSEKTFRNKMYDLYKAHRPPPPEDLVPQFALVRDATRAFGVPGIDPARRPTAKLPARTLKQWLDEHLPRIVDEHVRREISRITGKPL